MGTEIERKFLVKSDAWRAEAVGRSVLRQGYLAAADGNTVRIRLDGDRAWLTVKGPASGRTRSEFEYGVPLDDAAALLALCGTRIIEKTRNRVPCGDHLWEVDEFTGRNAGLVTAEVETATESEAVRLPEWIGREVTGDHKYDNASLSVRPFTTWEPEELRNRPL